MYNNIYIKIIEQCDKKLFNYHETKSFNQYNIASFSNQNNNLNQIDNFNQTVIFEDREMWYT